MKVVLTNFILLIIALFTSNPTKSQIKDFESWSEVEIRYNISQKLRFSLNEEIRFDHNSTRIKKYFTDIGLSYKVTKYLKVAVNYRFIQNNYSGYYGKGHRYYADLSLKKEIKRASLYYRTRFYSQYIDFYSSEDGHIPENYWRNRISIKYDIKSKAFTPFAAYEIFYQISNYGENIFNKSRFTVGTEYEINKKNTFEVFYRIQPRFNVNNPRTSYILGLSYIFSLDKKSIAKR